MTLFDPSAVELGFLGPPGHAEPLATYLARSDRAIAAGIRSTLESWMMLVPSESDADVRQRLLSNDNQQTYAAFWELYLAATFHALELDIEWHPSLPGTSRHPDFRVSRDGETLAYVEACVVNPSNAVVAASNRHGRLRAAMSAWEHNNVVFGMMTGSEGPTDLPTAALKQAVFRWVDTLEPEEPVTPEDPIPKLRSMTWASDGWELEIYAFDKATPGAEQFGLATYDHGGSPLIDNITPLRKSLEAKARRYGAIEAPFLIAALTNRDFSTVTDVAGALFGRTGSSSRGFDLLPLTPQNRLLKQGLWRDVDGARYTRVSAVLCARGLHPSNIGAVMPELWTNGWAAHPLGDWLPHWRWFHTEETVSTRQTLCTAADLLGVPEDWPTD